MPATTKAIVEDLNGRPAPQVFDSAADAYQAALGTNGRQHVILYGADGNPLPRFTNADPGIVTVGSDVDVRPAALDSQIDVITVPTAATLLSTLLAGVGGVLAGRRMVELQNLAGGDLYIGDSNTVAVNNGRRVRSTDGDGTCLLLLSDAADKYVVASADATVAVLQQ